LTRSDEARAHLQKALSILDSLDKDYERSTRKQAAEPS
jgi:hypothetical protein